MSHKSLDSLILACQQFVSILDAETDLLNSNNIAAANELLKDKQHAADMHQNACTLFEAENALAQCSSGELAVLKETIDRLHASLINNKEAIDIAHKVRSTIIDKITIAVKEQQAPVCQYTKAAKFSTNSSPVSMLALNRQI